MRIEDLNRKGIDELLMKVEHGDLGTVDSEGKPYVVPVSFKYVDGAIYMFFDFDDRGEKVANIHENSNVCFTVTSVDPPNSMLRSERSRNLSSVIARGNAEKVMNEEEKIKVYGEAFVKRLRKVRPKGVYFKIKPKKITGKSYTMKT